MPVPLQSMLTLADKKIPFVKVRPAIPGTDNEDNIASRDMLLPDRREPRAEIWRPLAMVQWLAKSRYVDREIYQTAKVVTIRYGGPDVLLGEDAGRRISDDTVLHGSWWLYISMLSEVNLNKLPPSNA